MNEKIQSVTDDEEYGFDTPEDAEAQAAFRRKMEQQRQRMPMGALLKLSVAAKIAGTTQDELLIAIESGELRAVKSLRTGFDKYRVYKTVLDEWRNKRNQCLKS